MLKRMLGIGLAVGAGLVLAALATAESREPSEGPSPGLSAAKADYEAAQNAPLLRAQQALICDAFGPEHAAAVSWCSEAEEATQTDPAVAELLNSGQLKASIDGDTVTVIGPSEDEVAISTFDPEGR